MFPEPLQFTGPDTRELGRSDGKPTPWHCRDCSASGKGIMAHVAHWKQTGHVIRFGARPALVTVCAWCSDSQERTAALKRLGREVTHGMCEAHRAEFEAGR